MEEIKTRKTGTTPIEDIFNKPAKEMNLDSLILSRVIKSKEGGNITGFVFVLSDEIGNLRYFQISASKLNTLLKELGYRLLIK